MIADASQLSKISAMLGDNSRYSQSNV